MSAVVSPVLLDTAESPLPKRHRPSPLRPTIEFLVVLMIGILFARTFAAEAYIVPTGSMAPVLLGLHRDFTCPSCGLRFALGMDEQGWSGRPVCPNCGMAEWEQIPGVIGSGDRLLVQKYLFDLRAPRRWEAAVFLNPADPSQAYVKRIVGLPGESIQIQDGDIRINGRVARKTLAEQRAMRIPVYDNNYLPADVTRNPRWVFRRGGRRNPSGWMIRGTGFVRLPPREVQPDEIDWMLYRNWQPERGGYGPVLDFLPYNGLDLPGENRVDDLMIEADVAVDTEAEGVAVRLQKEGDRFLVVIPVDGHGPVKVRRNGRTIPVETHPVVLPSSPPGAPEPVRLEASLIDQRLLVAIDGQLLFEPYDFDNPTPGLGSFASPVGLGAVGPGIMQVERLQINRDVYYTDALANAPKQPFGVGEPFRLGPGEFFVLGDNSPVSNDSRFWPESPVVRRELFLGKPFLVHLPSQAVPLEVFGREVYWIPDPREIRYIR